MGNLSWPIELSQRMAVILENSAHCDCAQHRKATENTALEAATTFPPGRQRRLVQLFKTLFPVAGSVPHKKFWPMVRATLVR